MHSEEYWWLAQVDSRNTRAKPGRRRLKLDKSHLASFFSPFLHSVAIFALRRLHPLIKVRFPHLQLSSAMSSTPTLTETVKPPKKKFKLEDDRFVANIEEKIRENQVSSLKENPNSIPNLCPNCLLLLSLCICPQLPSPFGLIGRMSNLMDVIIYSHFNEIMHESACNTGRWLMWAGAKSVIRYLWL